MTRAATPKPEVRNAHFQLDDAIPRDWHGGRAAVSIFFDNLSTFFPAGERFFIASVKAHRDAVADEGLAEQVRAFCGQEGMHTREHVRYNERLRECGYPVESMERRVEALLERVRERAPARRRLGVTCALEHFTAIMAHALLDDPRALEDAHPKMAALWRWHAAEETEHKSVAFDVFRAAGGTYAERVGTMIGATAIFWGKILEHQIRMMRARGLAASPSEWASLLSYLFVRPGPMRTVIRLYFPYYRPGFHPWDLDDRALLEAWKRELGRSEIYREVMRTGAPA